MPVRNEEANLAACLARLSRFAEVVVIDSGSTDRTQEIAQEFGARIVDFAYDGRYPKKRNWFLLNAPPTQPWVLTADHGDLCPDMGCRMGNTEKSIVRHGKPGAGRCYIG
jgi:glycosyltransferase involved in cell wall biosynthesis